MEDLLSNLSIKVLGSNLLLGDGRQIASFLLAVFQISYRWRSVVPHREMESNVDIAL